MNPRRARQMVQYHIEGEHVFPEPECPSCRLDEALRRAADAIENGFFKTEAEETYFAGWADAARALDAARKARLATDDWQRECVKQAHGFEHDRCGECFLCLERKAIHRFCDTMLEKEKTDG